MSDLKTHINDSSVDTFIQSIKHEVRKHDAIVLLALYEKITQQPAKMWGSAIIGFGIYSYQNCAGKTTSWMRSAFSPRKQYMSLYLMAGIQRQPELLDKLGKHKHGKACLNINKLADVDISILEQLIRADLEVMNERYP